MKFTTSTTSQRRDGRPARWLEPITSCWLWCVQKWSIKNTAPGRRCHFIKACPSQNTVTPKHQMRARFWPFKPRERSLVGHFPDACLCPYQLNLLKSWLDAFELSGFKMHWKCSDQARPKTLDLVELPWFPNDPSLNYGESAVPVAANSVPQSLIPSSPVGTITPERNANKKEWTYNTSCACSVTLPLRSVIMT